MAAVRYHLDQHAIYLSSSPFSSHQQGLSSKDHWEAPAVHHSRRRHELLVVEMEQELRYRLLAISEREVVHDEHVRQLGDLAVLRGTA